MKHTDPPLPANVDAEKAILGAVLLDNTLFEATTCLCADDFSLDSHRRIYLRIADMMEAGEAVDPITLVERLGQEKELQDIGDLPVAYISDLSTNTIRYRPAVRDWVRIVKAKSLQRRLIGICESALNQAYAGESGWSIIAALKEDIEEIEMAAKRGIRA